MIKFVCRAFLLLLVLAQVLEASPEILAQSSTPTTSLSDSSFDTTPNFVSVAENTSQFSNELPVVSDLANIFVPEKDENLLGFSPNAAFDTGLPAWLPTKRNLKFMNVYDASLTLEENISRLGAEVDGDIRPDEMEKFFALHQSVMPVMEETRRELVDNNDGCKKIYVSSSGLTGDYTFTSDSGCLGGGYWSGTTNGKRIWRRHYSGNYGYWLGGFNEGNCNTYSGWRTYKWYTNGVPDDITTYWQYYQYGFSSSISTTCYCDDGKHSSSSNSCLATCPAGRYGSGNRAWNGGTGGSSCSGQCAVGKYSAAGATSCTSCPAGRTSTAGSGTCTDACTAGEFISGSGCADCPVVSGMN